MSIFDELMEQASIAATECDAHMSEQEREAFIERWMIKHACDACEGEGYIDGNQCRICKATGRRQ